MNAVISLTIGVSASVGSTIMFSMKTKLTALSVTAVLGLTLTGCSNDGDTDDTSSTKASVTSAAPVMDLPTVDELNHVLSIATNPEVPFEERIRVIQGGQHMDPSLIDTMIQAKNESGANFEVVGPVLDGYGNGSALATVAFTYPEQEPQTDANVEFIYEDDTWKVSQKWVCLLISNTVPPEQVPPICIEEVPPPPPPAGDPALPPPPAEGMPAPEGAPMPPAPEGAPAPEMAPPPPVEGAPAPAPAPEMAPPPPPAG